ncbi:MAG TPA: PilZ domain-containing protein [Allosphingosinicella sp.]|nr:PilZ domain-containing protein [Allosphingosinicella sp.]
MAPGTEMLSADAAEETTYSVSAAAPEPCARGDEPRRMTTLRVGTIAIEGRRELCLIRNVSCGGLRAYVYSPLKEGQQVSVELKTNQQTAGSVSWVDGSTVGISFNEPIDIAELLASQIEGEGGMQPRMPRVEADCLGELRIGARLYPISTCDVSQGGVRIEIDHPLRVGENVVLTLQKLRPVQGVVRWYEDGQSGIGFNQVLPFHELVNWLRHH